MAASTSKEVTSMRDQVRCYYEHYSDDPYFIPSTRAYLFNKTQEDTLLMHKVSL
jgi:hypothetical protein